MKLVSHSREINSSTFEPVLRLTVDISLEGIHDYMILLKREDMCQVLGQELYDILKDLGGKS